MDATMGIVLVVILLIYLGLIGIVIANYIMNAIGFQTIAKRRGVKYPWMAWIPYANYWLIGSIADEYDQRKGLKKRWGKILVGLLIGYGVGFTLYFIAIIVMIIRTALQAVQGFYEPEFTTAMIGSFLFIYVVLIIFMILALILSIVYYICLYKIFESTVPDKSAKYLILSIAVPLALGICLLRCRNKGYSLEDEKSEPVEQAIEAPEANVGIADSTEGYPEEMFEED